MKNLAVANGLSLSPYASRPLPGGKTALEKARDYARSLPEVEQAILLVLKGQAIQPPEGFKVEVMDSLSIEELLARLQKLAAGCENIFYFFADCPLLDAELSRRMLQNHQRYFADYTFADGYPFGLAPEILKPAILPPLRELAAKPVPREAADAGAQIEKAGLPAQATASTQATAAAGNGGTAGSAPALQADSRGALFELIKMDINSFDIETELSPSDLRLLRVALCADSRRNFLLLHRIMDAGAKDAETACRLVAEKPELLRTLPSLFSIQIVEGCPQLCSYCPYPVFSIKDIGKKGEMELDRFRSILDQIAGFCEDAVVSVSLWGEPAYHSRFPELAGAVMERGLRLIVETSGVGWQKSRLAAILGDRRGLIDWVVSLDAPNPELYRSLRGEGYGEALQTIETLQAAFPGHVFVQAVRMKENEEILEDFYRHWKARTGQVIIQKYDHFCGFLPDRRVTDLSPLKRFPCWHLKRDVHVLIDGRVPFCREDVGCRYLLGSLFQEGLEQVWAAGEKYYRDHLRLEYPQLCTTCDEYYTFNF